LQNHINKAQILASDPDISAWVSASAGTGKTRILTNRVLRLLLAGASPNKILCLTFTKAAAKEMEDRINESLLSWKNIDSKNLFISLENILGHSPTNDQLAIAPNLFFAQINSVFPIKIQTIHSFCQFILDKFPLEAQVAPGFKVIDEFKSAEIISKIRIDIISNNHMDSTDLQSAINFVAGNLHDVRISALIEKIVQDKVKFLELFAQYASMEDYKKSLEAEFLKQSVAVPEVRTISLIDAEEKDLVKLETYNKLVEKGDFTSPEFINFFLTLEFEPRKTLLSKKWATTHPEEFDLLLEIQKYVWEYIQQEKAKNLIQYSAYLFVIAKYILGDYEHYKRIYGYLDYDDLIIKTRNLLINSDVKEWVLYKLDGGLEHILVDEAQDTSKEQWEIIEAIASEFYSGVTRSDKNRTLFVVGDEKQSIYSFQGANPEYYKQMNEYFSKQMFAAQKIYKNIALQISYRSTKEINEFVAQTFEGVENFPSAFLVTNRLEQHGVVEVWPTIFSDSEEVESWPLPINKESSASYEKLAAKIADYISELDSFSPSDFLILVRKRSDFVNSVIRHLEERKIKVAGIDRMRIMENIVSLDILSLAKFILLPEDDLNLAGFLKSPFVGLQESELLDLCVSRRDLSLYQFILLNRADLAHKLSVFQKKYIETSLSGFFLDILEIEGFRSNLLAAHGMIANDVINEFLDLASNFERDEQNSLQNFVFWLENADIELKRDLESSDSVRIMTIHGSKGLQSKVVILVEAATSRFPTSMFLWHEDGYYLFPGSSANYIKEYERLLDVQTQKDYAEYLRLRYVGLTRAEDRLIIATYS
jgi:ATP-dependent helicase/nuclease subunit A